MTFSEFKAVWDANQGDTCCAVIVFDNAMKWFMNDRKIYTTKEDGKPCARNEVRYGEYIPPKDIIIMDPKTETVKRKVYLTGVTARQIAEGTNLWLWDVRHVENIQAMFFCDPSNMSSRIAAVDIHTF